MSNLVSVRVSNSFFAKPQMRLRISIDLDFSDSKKKSLIYYSWRTENNVPDFWPQLRSQIKELRKSRAIFKLTDMTLVHNKDGSFIDLILEDFRNFEPVMKKLKEMYSFQDVMFSVKSNY